ncbi:hypothetical protein V4P56_04115 [Bartonella sp. B35(2025)]
MLIQSFLFFILGIAFTSWLLVLFSPLIWRKAVYFAHKFASEQIPLSLTEIQANQDFFRAQHAIELTRNEQKYNSLQEKYAQQKIQLSQVKEQLYRSILPTQYAPDSIHEKNSIMIKNKQSDPATNTFIMAMETMHEKIIHYQKRLQKIHINELNTGSGQQLLDELREEIKELAATLAAQIAIHECESSPINTLIKNSKSENDLASLIHKKIASTKKTPLK